MTALRFNSGNCDLTIQARNRRNTPDRYLVFPYWRIARLSQRIISDDVCSFAVSLVRNDDLSEPQNDSATSAVMVDTIVALNIFDPDRTPQAEKEAVKHAAESREADLERQLVDAQIHRAELESLLETLQQTQGGITKEQTDLIRQRIEVYDQQIERIQEQLKALQPNSADSSEADLERQLQEAVKNHTELDSLHKTLEQTPGATKEQVELVRQRLERSEQRVKLLQDKLKKLRP